MKVTLIAATSLNGIIQPYAHAQRWHSVEDRRRFVGLTKQSGVVIMGRGTWDSLKRPLTDRLNIVLTSKPLSSNSYPNVRQFSGDITSLTEQLKATGVESVYVLGGQRIFTDFLNQRQAHFLDVTLEPYIFSSGLAMFGSLAISPTLTLISSEKLSTDTVNLRYGITYP